MATERGLRVGEAVLGAGALALGVFVAVQTAALPVGPAHAAVGPRLFPYLVAAGLVLVALALLREALLGHVAHEAAAAAAHGWELDWPAVALVAAALLAEILLLEWAGWILAAAVLFVLVARAFGSRRLLADLALGLALTATTYVVFGYGLDLTLPAGSLLELLAPADAAAGR